MVQDRRVAKAFQWDFASDLEVLFKNNFPLHRSNSTSSSQKTVCETVFNFKALVHKDENIHLVKMPFLLELNTVEKKHQRLHSATEGGVQPPLPPLRKLSSVEVDTLMHSISLGMQQSVQAHRNFLILVEDKKRKRVSKKDEEGGDDDRDDGNGSNDGSGSSQASP